MGLVGQLKLEIYEFFRQDARRGGGSASVSSNKKEKTVKMGTFKFFSKGYRQAAKLKGIIRL